MRAALVLLVLATVVSCGRQHHPVAPTLLEASKRFRNPAVIVTLVTAVPRAFRPGESTRIEVTVMNRGAWPATLHFRNGCTILFQVLDEAGEVVAPGGFVCTLAEVRFDLAPGQSTTRVFTWEGDRYDPMSGQFRPLPPGTYDVIGVLNTSVFHHPSEPVQVELIP
jgi:hypothetical protein